MMVRKWLVVDVYYRPGERDAALKYVKHFEKMGYDAIEEGEGFGEWGGTIQTLKIYPAKDRR